MAASDGTATRHGSVYQIATNERAVFVGKTGSGKTYLARALAEGVERLVVFDPKGTLWKPDWALVDWSDAGEKLLRKQQPCRLRVPAPLRGQPPWEYYMGLVWEAGDCLTYIDEVYGVALPGRPPSPELSALYTRGRERGVGTWGATQRPAWVPLFVISEAEWAFCFKLQLEDDRVAMVKRTGAPEFAIPVPAADRYGFRFYNAQWEHARYSRGVAA